MDRVIKDIENSVSMFRPQQHLDALKRVDVLSDFEKIFHNQISLRNEVLVDRNRLKYGSFNTSYMISVDDDYEKSEKSTISYELSSMLRSKWSTRFRKNKRYFGNAKYFKKYQPLKQYRRQGRSHSPSWKLRESKREYLESSRVLGSKRPKNDIDEGFIDTGSEDNEVSDSLIYTAEPEIRSLTEKKKIKKSDYKVYDVLRCEFLKKKKFSKAIQETNFKKSNVSSYQSINMNAYFFGKKKE